MIIRQEVVILYLFSCSAYCFTDCTSGSVTSSVLVLNAGTSAQSFTRMTDLRVFAHQFRNILAPASARPSYWLNYREKILEPPPTAFHLFRHRILRHRIGPCPFRIVGVKFGPPQFRRMNAILPSARYSSETSLSAETAPAFM